MPAKLCVPYRVHITLRCFTTLWRHFVTFATLSTLPGLSSERHKVVISIIHCQKVFVKCVALSCSSYHFATLYDKNIFAKNTCWDSPKSGTSQRKSCSPVLLCVTLLQGLYNPNRNNTCVFYWVLFCPPSCGQDILTFFLCMTYQNWQP